MPESVGFRRGMGVDDALFVVRRLDAEISAWRSLGWGGEDYLAVLIDLKKAYPTANKKPFFATLRHLGVAEPVEEVGSGLQGRGRFWNTLVGFHCTRQYAVRVGGVGLSDTFQPTRGFGEGCGTSPLCWNVLYSVIARASQAKREEAAIARGLVCGIPWRWRPGLELCSSWTRKNDDREFEVVQVASTIFADDTTLHGTREELLGMDEAHPGVPSGLDAFSGELQGWGSLEHPEKREVHVFGESGTGIKLVGGGIDPDSATKLAIARGCKAWGKLGPLLKGSLLPGPKKGELITMFVSSALTFGCKTQALRRREVNRMQSVVDRATRYACGTTLRKMREVGINHSDLRARLSILAVQAMVDRDQLRWAGHVARMPLATSRTYAAYFANGTVCVGDFQRQDRGGGGRITASRRSLQEGWAALGLRHGITPDALGERMQERVGWGSIVRQGVGQSAYEDRTKAHRAERLADPGLRPAAWRRGPSPHQKRRKLAAQRERRAQQAAAAAEEEEDEGAVGDPGAGADAAPPDGAVGGAAGGGEEEGAGGEGGPPQPARRLPRQLARAAAGKTHYTGAGQERVSAEERAQWPWACEHPGCGLRYQTERALKIHVPKAGKENGTHWLLERDAVAGPAAAAAEG